jgi:hypothetical protein
MSPCSSLTPLHDPAACSQRGRGRERRALFVPDLSVIDPREFAVDVIADRLARRFTVEHHYSGSHPGARLSLGLFRNGAARQSRLVRMATFSVPIKTGPFSATPGSRTAAGRRPWPLRAAGRGGRQWRDLVPGPRLPPAPP